MKPESLWMIGIVAFCILFTASFGWGLCVSRRAFERIGGRRPVPIVPYGTEAARPLHFTAILQGVEKQASGRQPRRAAFWKAQHIRSYVSIYKSRTTPDHGVRRGFSTPC